jgi:hypothetical protein
MYFGLSLQVYHHYILSLSPRTSLFGAWPETYLFSKILSTGLTFFYFMVSRDSAVGIATGYGLDN